MISFSAVLMKVCFQECLYYHVAVCLVFLLNLLSFLVLV